MFVAALIAYALIAAQAAYYYPFISDDALISLQYAKRLLAGHGLTWTDGKPVEGYSNLLWILMAAFLGLLKIELVLSARILGFVFTAAAVLFFAMYALKQPGKSSLPAVAGFSALGLSSTLAIWAIGGLEQPLLAAVIGAFLFFSAEENKKEQKVINAPGFLLGLLCLTRPDSLIFVFSFAVSLFIFANPGERINRVLNLVALPLIFTLAQLMFRIAYYDEWLPNTAYIKLGFTEAHFDAGIKYLAAGISAMLPLFAAVIAGIFVLIRAGQKGKALFYGLPMISWAAYLLAVGGDIFPGFRHFTPLIVISAFILHDAVLIISEKTRARGTLAVAAAVLAVLYAVIQPFSGQNKAAKAERWEWHGKELGLMLKAAFGDKKPLIAVSAAGCIPFWSDLPAIDSLGLNDYTIARTKMPEYARSRIAHFRGNGQYMMDREPDLLVFCGPWGSVSGCFPGEVQMTETREFSQLYEAALFRISDDPKLETVMYIRRGSQKVGIRNEGGRIIIPAYLSAGDIRNAVHFDNNSGNFFLKLRPDSKPAVKAVFLEEGKYILSAESSNTLSAYVSLQSGIEGSGGRGNLPLVFKALRGTHVIELFVKEDTDLREVVIEKR